MIHAMVISMDNDTSRVCSCTIINIPKWWGQIGILGWVGLHLLPNTSECIIVTAAAVTAVRSKYTLPRDCGWVGERGWVE